MIAESIAEYTKRPLWTVSCSDLGHTPIVCEQKLTSSLKLAKKWNAVVLRYLRWFPYILRLLMLTESQ